VKKRLLEMSIDPRPACNRTLRRRRGNSSAGVDQQLCPEDFEVGRHFEKRRSMKIVLRKLR
jgi:hypothetical protein